MAGKYAKQDRYVKKVFLVIMIIVAIVVILLVFKTILSGKNVNGKNELLSNEFQDYPNQVEEVLFIEEGNKLSTLQIVEVDMPEKIEEYNVIGEIEIPKIGVKRYILDQTTDESIDLSVAKFWGPDLHEAGNFSIIGHNYVGLFKRLKELEISDTFTITARNGEICTYEIYDIYIVNPDEMECIEDSLIGQREVTLITCTTSGAQRLILKAKEHVLNV